MGAWLLFMGMMGGGGEPLPTGCDWVAVSNDAWITITGGASGTGDGMIAYDVAANAGVARIGTITVTGAEGEFTHTVYQAGEGDADPDAGTGAVVTWQREPLKDTSNEAYVQILYPHGYQAGMNVFDALGRPQRDTWAFGTCRSGQYNLVVSNGLVTVTDPATGLEIAPGTELEGVDLWLISETSSMMRQ